MRRVGVLLAILAVVGSAGSVPAQSGAPGLIKLSFCTGDGNLQIFGDLQIVDDIYFYGDVGCVVEGGSGYAYPMHVETIIFASTVGPAGACGPTGVEAPLQNLRMRVKMTLTLEGKTYTAVRTLHGSSSGDFPGSTIDGKVRDPVGVVALGSFRFEPFPGFYCAHHPSYLRLWDVVLAPTAVA